MHPLRTLIAISLTLALAISVAFAFILKRAVDVRGVPPASDLAIGIIAAAVFAAFLLPAAGVYAWALRRAGDLQTLADRSVEVVEGSYDRIVADREFHGELDELARAIEQLRQIIVRQRASFEEQRALMQEIVAALGEGLLAINRQGRIVFANRKAAELFGSSDDLSGRLFLEIAQRQPLVAAFDRALQGSPSSVRTSIVVGGRERPMEIRVFPVARSTDIAAVALLIDVTTIERLQRIRRDFLDDFSHEVRTPLAGLRSAAESFEHGPLDPHQEAQLRRIILRQIDRLERLVKDLSELNRIESGELVLDRRRADVFELMRDLCADFSDRVTATQAFLTLRGDHSWACVDPGRIQQVFTNLLDNALKHGGGRGNIEIEVIDSPAETIVRVCDQGEGIPPEDVARIFHRFYRVDKSRSQAVPGLGLGLAITKHLIRLHGGSVRAENRPEGGAMFEVKLPKKG